MSKEGILSIFIDLKDRAQRFHPSKFCGSIFCCSVVRCLPQPLAGEAANLNENETSGACPPPRIDFTTIWIPHLHPIILT